jgi:hypothetical protein
MDSKWIPSMAEKSEKIQVSVDQTTFQVLSKMSDKHLRGQGISQIAGRILEEWVWNNQNLLKENGIPLVEEPLSKPPLKN